MKTVGEVIDVYVEELSKIYDKDEAKHIAVMVFEELLNYRRIDISFNKKEVLKDEVVRKFDSILTELKKSKPVQYVLGHAWFSGMKLSVNENVLIPRRETEELVEWISKENKNPLSIIDFCTGSGCIALALKLNFPYNSKVRAIDISEKALDVAKQNSIDQHLEVDFIHADVLKFNEPIKTNIIVSNPPYILEGQRLSMHKNVTDFEPAIALFVTDDDPLVFYKRIAEWGMKNLDIGGRIYFEINEIMSDEISELHSQLGYTDFVLRKDMQERNRMFRATKPF